MQNINDTRSFQIPEGRNLEKFNSFGDGDIYDLLDDKNIHKIDIRFRINILCIFIDRLMVDKSFKMRWGKNGNNYPKLLKSNEKYFLNHKDCYDFASEIKIYYLKKQQLIKQQPLNKIRTLFEKKILLGQSSVAHIPKRYKPINVSEKTIIGKGNHATVYAQSSFAIKDLRNDKVTIKLVKAGIDIIDWLAKRYNLLEYNILQEKIIFDSEDHIQYIAPLMDGESQKVSTEDFSITQQFGMASTKSILFLNENGIKYSNFKPCNFLYKSKPDGKYNFYLQDFGGISLLRNINNKIQWIGNNGTNSFSNKFFQSIIMSRDHAKMIRDYSINQIVKSGNLAGLIFTIIAFHHKCGNINFNFLREKYKDKELFAEFMSKIGIIDSNNKYFQNIVFLIYKVCYADSICSEYELNKMEEILYIWLISRGFLNKSQKKQ